MTEDIIREEMRDVLRDVCPHLYALLVELIDHGQDPAEIMEALRAMKPAGTPAPIVLGLCETALEVLAEERRKALA